MGDIDTAVRGAQQLEALLEQRFGAEGRGLHEKLSSVEHQIPVAIVKRVRWIASLRNRVVHEGEEIEDVDNFERAVADVRARLAQIPARKGDVQSADGERPPAPSVAPQRPKDQTGTVAALVGLLVAFGIFVLVMTSKTAQPNELKRDTQALLPAAARDAAAPEDDPVAAALAAPSAAPITPGSLAGLAQRAARDAAQGRTDIDAMWSGLQRDTHIKLGELDVKDNGDGTSDMLAPVTWDIDPKPILSTLNKYFWDYKHRPIRADAVDFKNADGVDFGDHIGESPSGIVVRRLWNESKDPKRPFSEELLGYLTGKLARIRIAAGKHSGTLTIAAGRKCFVSCGGFGHDVLQIQINNQNDAKVVLFSNSDGDQNPVRIAHVPTSELAGISKLAVTVEVVSTP